MVILTCSKLLYPTLWIAQPSEDISQCFYNGRETHWGHNMVFISDED